MQYSYPITIHHIFISSGHNYFGHRADKLGTNPTFDLEQVEAVAEHGLKGDRFFGLKEGFDGQVTFFAKEVFEKLAQLPGFSDISPLALRRNIVVAGVPLNALIGYKFEIRAGGDNIERENSDGARSVHFYGARHCNPCRWMDIGVGVGALKFLKGRGGLRAKVLSSGTLHRGRAMLYTDVDLEPHTAVERLNYPQLPG